MILSSHAVATPALLALSVPSLRSSPVSSPRSRAVGARSRAVVAQTVAYSDIGTSSNAWLTANVDPDLSLVVDSLLTSCGGIATKVRTATCDSNMCFSPLMERDEEEEGEMAVDVLANEVIVSGLRATSRVAAISSEADGIDQQIGGKGFAVALEPLSGSSVIDTNFACGTIFGVWRGSSLKNVTGRELVAAGVCIYGPRTTFTVALPDSPGTHEFLLMEEATSTAPGRWAKSNAFGDMREGRLFAPANLRVAASHEGYRELLEFWQQHEYRLRYTGAACVDVVQLLVKGFGIFASPAGPGERAPLRLLYEAIPLAYLVEKAGGASSDGERSLLDIPVRNTDHRTQVAVGSPEEVSRFDSVVGPSPVSGWQSTSARLAGVDSE